MSATTTLKLPEMLKKRIAPLAEAGPTLRKKDIKAAIVYAADTLAHEEALLVGRRK